MPQVKLTPFFKISKEDSNRMSKMKEALPMDLGVWVNRYVDPFLGKGAALFEILSVPGMEEFIVSDMNRELINTYRQVQNHVDDVLEELQALENIWLEQTCEEKKNFYKSLLFRYERLQEFSGTDKNILKASMMIFLDAAEYITHMPGDGSCITAAGTEIICPEQAMKLTRVCDERTLRICSKLLQKVKIFCCDFRECLEQLNSRTLLYLDPPAVNGKKKTAYPFTEKDRQSVESIAKIARTLGAEVILRSSVEKY